jgi:prolycopene isomerase
MVNTNFSRREFIAAAGAGAAALTLSRTRLSAEAADLGPLEKYPVVVIGAGLGGLTCGAYLARAGFPVTVVEQHSIPGGYATAFERAAGKFRFEVSLHGTSINNNTPAEILAELGILERLDLVPLPEVFRIKTTAGDIVVPQGDPPSFIQRLSERFPAEADGIAGFVNQMLAIHGETEAYGRKGESLKRWTKFLFPLLNPNMWKVRRQTLADLLDDHVADPEVRHTLSFLWGYYGLPPEKLSAFYYAIATASYLKNGSFYISAGHRDVVNLLTYVQPELFFSNNLSTPFHRLADRSRGDLQPPGHGRHAFSEFPHRPIAQHTAGPHQLSVSARLPEGFRRHLKNLGHVMRQDMQVDALGLERISSLEHLLVFV